MYGSGGYLDCARREIELDFHLTVFARQVTLINFGYGQDKSYPILAYVLGMANKMESSRCPFGRGSFSFEKHHAEEKAGLQLCYKTLRPATIGWLIRTLSHQCTLYIPFGRRLPMRYRILLKRHHLKGRLGPARQSSRARSFFLEGWQS